MSDVLKRIYNACDPYEPATAERYCSCADARGSSELTDRFQSHLHLSDDHKRFLFTGHIGCGKSSELEHLSRTLKNPEQSEARYFPILVDASEYLDEYDVTPVDILLAIVTELAATLHEEFAINIQDNYFVKLSNELKSILLTDVDVKEGEISFGIGKARIQLLKRDPTARDAVRGALKPKLSSMLQEINIVFEKAQLAIKNALANTGEAPYKDFVLILDNLEKIQGFGGKGLGIESQRELFLLLSKLRTELSSKRSAAIAQRFPILTGQNWHSWTFRPIKRLITETKTIY